MTTYERGDVVEAGDPFNEGNRTRPFLLINTDAHPFQGEQYIAVTLTTKTWHEETLPLDASEFVEGGVPERSFVVPWGVTSPAHDDIDGWFGRVEWQAVDDVVDRLTSYIQQ